MEDGTGQDRTGQDRTGQDGLMGWAGIDGGEMGDGRWETGWEVRKDDETKKV